MGTVVGSWRLKLMVALILFAGFLGMSYGLFSNIDHTLYTEEHTSTYNTTWDNTIATDPDALNNSSMAIGNDILSIINPANYLNIITYEAIEYMPLRVMLNLVNVSIVIAALYIAFTFIKEFVPFV